MKNINFISALISAILILSILVTVIFMVWGNTVFYLKVLFTEIVSLIFFIMIYNVSDE